MQMKSRTKSHMKTMPVNIFLLKIFTRKKNHSVKSYKCNRCDYASSWACWLLRVMWLHTVERSHTNATRVNLCFPMQAYWFIWKYLFTLVAFKIQPVWLYWHPINPPMHYWLRGSIGFEKVQKVGQSRHLLAPLYERCSSDVYGLISPIQSIHPSHV